MLASLFGKKGPTPVQVSGYEQGCVHFISETKLRVGELDVLARLPDGELVEARVEIETALDEVDLYWARVITPESFTEKLLKFYPQPESETVEEEPQPFVERRKHARIARVLGVMSPNLSGFHATTHDISEFGIRLLTEELVPTGKQIRFRMELDDDRIKPLELKGEIIWCQRCDRGFWVGIRYLELGDEYAEILRKFVAAVKAREQGVFDTQYAAD